MHGGKLFQRIFLDGNLDLLYVGTWFFRVEFFNGKCLFSGIWMVAIQGDMLEFLLPFTIGKPRSFRVIHIECCELMWCTVTLFQ